MHASSRSRRSRTATVLTGAAALACLALDFGSAPAQDYEYRISQRATLSQRLGRTLVSLDYSRPLVRGRADVFGKVVHWGELWTPGANEATVLETDAPMKLEGHAIEPGRWSMWIIPSRVGPWEMVLDAQDSLFHTQRPELTEDDQVRFVVEPRWDGPETEALTWSFPRIAQDGGTLRLNWSTLQIDLDVDVESAQPVLTVAPEVADRYLGEWTITFSGNPSGGPAPPPMPLGIARGDDGTVLLKLPPQLFAPPPPPEEQDESALSPLERERAEARRALAATTAEFKTVMVPRADDIFLFGWLDADGVLLDIEKVFLEFETDGNRAVRLQVRDGRTDAVVATAARAVP